MPRRLVACLVFIVALNGVSAHGAQIIVDPLGEISTVTAAIDSAAFGDTLVLAHTTFFENPRILDKDLLIRSAPGGRAVLDGGPNGGGGNAGSVLRTVRSVVHIEDVVIQNGVPFTVGAGVMIFGGHVTLRRTRLEDNVCGVLAVQDGGVPGTLDMADCEVVGNAFGVDGLSSTRIVRTRFEGNDFALRIQGAVELEDVQVVNNGGPRIADTGGVILTGAFGRLKRVEVRNNSSARQHGGLWLRGGPLELIDCVIADNVSEGGPAGLVCLSVEASLSNVTIVNNHSRGPEQSTGGLLVDNRSDVQGQGCRIENNDSETRGGGVSVQRRSNLRLVDSRIVNNSSMQKGGGVYVQQSTAHLEKVVIAGNRSVGGGGVHVEDADVNLLRCTIAGNSANGGGGAVYNNATGRVEHSIVAFNTGTPGLFCAGGTVSTACSNVFGNDGDGLCGSDLGGNMSIDPLFCDFAPPSASFDVRLQENSPLRDVAGCGMLGALDDPCRSTSVTPISWSRLKQLYGAGRPH